MPGASAVDCNRGMHLHTIEVPDQETLALIRQELRAEGLLVEDAVEEI